MVFETSWEEGLDGASENKIFTRLIIDDSGRQILRFSVVYLSIVYGRLAEVLRYDFSEKESLHVHKFYLHKPCDKLYLSDATGFEFIEHCVQSIRANWRKYLLSFGG